MTGEGSPWAGMMRTAARLGIAPEAFWRLSLSEWRMLTGDAGGEGRISRAALTELTEGWPDD